MASDGLGRHQERLGEAFFQGDAEAHRQHLQLAMEEEAARSRIAEATGIHDPEVLAELAGLGIRVDTLSALTLIPLIQIAWVDGEMDDRERDAVLLAAVASGIAQGSTSYRLLEIWTLEAPPPDLLNAWKAFIRALGKQLQEGESVRLAENLLGRARDVAAAAGDALDRTPHISEVEEACLAELRGVFVE